MNLTLRGDSQLDRSVRREKKNKKKEETSRESELTCDDSTTILLTEFVQKVMYAIDLYRRAIPAVQKQF